MTEFFTISRDQTDYPNQFVVRRYPSKKTVAVSFTLEGARVALKKRAPLAAPLTGGVLPNTDGCEVWRVESA